MKYQTITFEESLRFLPAGSVIPLTLSTTANATAAITAKHVVIASTVFCWIRQGLNPTAVNDGTDIPIFPGTYLRLSEFVSGNKISAIAQEAGVLAVMPDA